MHVGHDLVHVRHLGPGRAEQDNRRGAPGLEAGQQGPHGPDRPDDVHVVVVVPGVVAEGVERPPDAAAHGDDQNVEPLAVAVLRPQTGFGIVRGHVHAEPSDLSRLATRAGRNSLADAGRGLLQPGRVAGRDRDRSALGCQQAGGGQSDTGRAPHHQGLPAR